MNKTSYLSIDAKCDVGATQETITSVPISDTTGITGLPGRSDAETTSSSENSP